MYIEQDAELGQLREVIGQLQAEKEKASGRAEKLVEDLKGEQFMVGVVAELISSLNKSLWCL